MRSMSLKSLSFSSGTMSRPDTTRSNLSTWLTLAAMSLGYGIVQLDVTIVNTALNNIGDSLGGGVSELQWIVSAYTIAFAALILTRSAISGAVSLRSWRGPDKVDA